MRLDWQPLYPFESHFLDLGGLRYHYIDEGRGEPVVMVHGNPTWSFYYRNLVLFLRRRFRCIVPDHIGCGLSDKPDDRRYEYTLRRRVEDLGSLLSSLDLDRLNLVVHDWGGMIGLAWAVENPERVRRLVILNTAGFHLPAAKKLPWQLWLVRNTALGAVLVRGLNAFSRGALICAVRRRKLNPAERAGYRAPYDSWAHRIATLRFVQDIPLRSGDPAYALVSRVEEELSKLAQVPALICWGEKDLVFDHHFLSEWERHLPRAVVHRFRDCGHYVLEDARDEIAGLVQGFLEEARGNG